MLLSGSGNKKEKLVPVWANFFEAEQFDHFVKALDTYFTELGMEYKLLQGQIHVSDKRFGASKLGLTNIAQICRQAGLNDYDRLVAAHFGSLETAEVFLKELNAKAHDFEHAKEYLGIRIYNREYILNIEEGITVGKFLTDDIYAMLVFDMPGSIMNVRPEQTIQWNKTNEELFEIGIENIRKNYEFVVYEDKIDDITILLATADHFFTPNIIFELESDSDLKGTHGTLIGIPNRHSALVFPIENGDVVKALNILIPVVHGMNLEGPGSISEKIFWYRDGELTELSYEIVDKTINFNPPAEFAELLDVLGV